MTSLPHGEAQAHAHAHAHDLQAFAHSHACADEGQSQRERALSAVTLPTLATMGVALVVGWWTGSLALTADGWHMGTHALALGGAVLACRLSLRAASHRAPGCGHRPRAPGRRRTAAPRHRGSAPLPGRASLNAL